MRAFMHRHRKLAVASSRPIDGGADLGDRLIAAECLVAKHVNKPPKIELYQRIRVAMARRRASPCSAATEPRLAVREAGSGEAAYAAHRERSGSGNADTGS
jgi:hypothetical protein